MNKNIILVGYRGSGKTSTSELIAKKMKMNVVSTDKKFEEKYGKIKNFVSQNGWHSFRELESEIIKGIKDENAIIDCGGGIVERDENIKNLKNIGVIFWLKTDAVNIVNRIKDSSDRPRLTSKKTLAEEIEEVMKRRKTLYKQSADFEIDTNKKTIEEVADEVILIYSEIKKITNKNQKAAAVVASDTTKNSIKALKQAEKISDIIEVRIDFIKDINDKNLKGIIDACRKNTTKIIITNRKKEEGGKFELGEDERVRLLKKAVDFGAEYVDIEMSTGKAQIENLIRGKKGTKIICSYHNFTELPKNIERIYDELKSVGADIIKISFTGKSVKDNIIAFNLISKAKKENISIIAIMMGEHGKLSRLMSGF